VNSFARILKGELDEVPETFFLMKGTVDEVWEEYEKARAEQK
jgi:F0F1-type ATP synthase beta subunit